MVLNNGIILRKLQEFQEYLNNLQKHIPNDLNSFKSDWAQQKVAERSLQVMIEIIIDVAERILAVNDILPAKSSAEAVAKLEEIKVIKNAEIYVNMVRFRNKIVHNYDKIDLEIIYSILKNRMNDFKTFIEEINNYEKSKH